MASISSDSGGRRTIQFVARDKRRRSIRLGKCSQRQAEAFCVKIEYLIVAQASGTPPDADTASWVASLSDQIHARVAAVGLVAPRTTQTVAGWCQEFFNNYNRKPNTKDAVDSSIKHILACLPPEKRLREITPEDAQRFADYLLENLASSTAQLCLVHTRMIFRAALKRNLIDSNPFTEVSITGRPDPARQAFIEPATVRSILATMECPVARLVLALARWGGLRIPSELAGLEWANVNYDRARFLVRSPKTERCGKGQRWVPMFPELVPFFRAAQAAAPQGESHVIPSRYRRYARSYWGDVITKRIALAGLEPWPKLFVNLRASRETELVEVYPIHVVTGWLGNSPAVAAKHYLRTTEQHFQHAAQSGAKSGALDGAHPVQTSRQQEHANICENVNQTAQTDASAAVSTQTHASTEHAVTFLESEGIRDQLVAQQEVCVISAEPEFAKSGALLADLLKVWGALGEPERLELIRLATLLRDHGA